MDKNSDIFLEIKWTINDIQELLKANNCDYSDESIEKFLKNLDIDYMEEKCIEFGWDLLYYATPKCNKVQCKSVTP